MTATINLKQLRERFREQRDGIISHGRNPATYMVPVPVDDLLALIDTAEAAIEWATEHEGLGNRPADKRLRETLNHYNQ